ncbi:MAG: hypothetical protein HY558_00060 [Euryarchaeota archaeon]|nr:hypothetical protein [Euryarchaeota archaeon]
MVPPSRRMQKNTPWTVHLAVATAVALFALLLLASLFPPPQSGPHAEAAAPKKPKPFEAQKENPNDSLMYIGPKRDKKGVPLEEPDDGTKDSRIDIAIYENDTLIYVRQPGEFQKSYQLTHAGPKDKTLTLEKVRVRHKEKNRSIEEVGLSRTLSSLLEREVKEMKTKRAYMSDRPKGWQHNWDADHVLRLYDLELKAYRGGYNGKLRLNTSELFDTFEPGAEATLSLRVDYKDEKGKTKETGRDIKVKVLPPVLEPPAPLSATLPPAPSTSGGSEGLARLLGSGLVGVAQGTTFPTPGPPNNTSIGSWYFGDLHLHSEYDDGFFGLSCHGPHTLNSLYTLRDQTVAIFGAGKAWFTLTSHQACFDTDAGKWNNMRNDCNNINADDSFICFPSMEGNPKETNPNDGQGEEFLCGGVDLPCTGSAAHMNTMNMSNFITQTTSQCVFNNKIYCPDSPDIIQLINQIYGAGYTQSSTQPYSWIQINHPGPPYGTGGTWDYSSIQSTPHLPHVEYWNGQGAPGVSGDHLMFWVTELLKGRHIWGVAVTDNHNDIWNNPAVFNGVWANRLNRTEISRAINKGHMYGGNGLSLLLDGCNMDRTNCVNKSDWLMMGDTFGINSSPVGAYRDNTSSSRFYDGDRIRLRVSYDTSDPYNALTDLSGTLYVYRGIIGNTAEVVIGQQTVSGQGAVEVNDYPSEGESAVADSNDQFGYYIYPSAAGAFRRNGTYYRAALVAGGTYTYNTFTNPIWVQVSPAIPTGYTGANFFIEVQKALKNIFSLLNIFLDTARADESKLTDLSNPYWGYKYWGMRLTIHKANSTAPQKVYNLTNATIVQILNITGEPNATSGITYALNQSEVALQTVVGTQFLDRALQFANSYLKFYARMMDRVENEFPWG